MRSSLACERCRKSKIKCINEGHPPCRACSKSGTAANACVLSRPSAPSSSRRAVAAAEQHSSPSASTWRRTSSRAGGNHPYLQRDGRYRRQTPERRRGGPPRASCSPALENSFAEIPNKVWGQCLSVFRQHFPEHGFIHPNDLEVLANDPSEHTKLKLLAILTLVNRYMSVQDPDSDTELAAMLDTELEHRLTEAPTFPLVQAFLVLALREWGDGQMHRAWIHSGIATRMMQSLIASKQVAEMAGAESAMPATTPELTDTENRTVWACFVLDRYLSCGKRRPAMMALHDIGIPLPKSDAEFAFELAPTCLLTGQELSNEDDESGWSTLRETERHNAHHLRMMVLGINIWSKIHGWVAMGGRKLPGMVQPQNSPWRPGSQWARLRGELDLWRSAQDSRFKHPDTRISAHIHLRQGEPVAYINLVYYLSIIFLCREFIPFLPVNEKGPKGPIDAPIFQEDAPEGWWERNSHELFNAAEQISSIVSALHDANASFYNPLTAICLFTAAMTNIYAAKFPALNCYPTGNPKKLTEENMHHLSRIAKFWKLAQGYLDVVSVVSDLYDQVASHQARLSSHSREHFLHLEGTINLDQSRQEEGLQLSKVQTELTSLPPANRQTRNEKDSTGQQQRADGCVSEVATGGNTDLCTDDLLASLSADYPMLDEDVWRVWTFCDDVNF